MKRPGIDVELCPPGTMALLESLEWEWDGNWCHVCENHRSEGHRADCKLSAILTAHRSQLDPGPTIEQAAGRTQSFFAVCENAQAARQSYVFDANAEAQEPPKLEIDYTSETEDLTTWPQTRGPEWRRMGMDEVLQIGDSWAHTDGHYLWVGKIISTLPVKAMKSKEAWTRRPAPEAQP